MLFSNFQENGIRCRKSRKRTGKNVNFPKKQLTKNMILLYTIILKVSANLTGELVSAPDLLRIRICAGTYTSYWKKEGVK